MRVLFLTHRLPYAPNRGDRARAFHMLRLLAARAEVDLVSLVHDDDERAHARDLQAYGCIVTTARVPRHRNAGRAFAALGGPTPLTHVLLDSPELTPALASIVESRAPDVLLTYCSGMARFALEPPLNRIPFVLDMVDVDSAKWRALSERTRGPRRWIYEREAESLQRFETAVVARARATVVVNERERAMLNRIAPAASVHVVPNGVDACSLRSPHLPAADASVIFCGVMNYEPNRDAALWLADAVWPLVTKQRPDARLRLVGADPPAAVLKLHALDPTIEVTGSVPDVRPYLWSSSVAVAPLVIAHGVQNKVLESVAAGLPSVVTSPVFQGLPPEVASACTVADRCEEFAAEIVRLLAMSPCERRAIAEGASLGALDWRHRLAPLWPILESVAKPSAVAMAFANRVQCAPALPIAGGSCAPSGSGHAVSR